jgi:hypothetical protein
MEKKFTPHAKFTAFSFFTIFALFLNLFLVKTYAQVSCPNESVIWLETFGTGTIAHSNPDVVITGLTYQASGPLAGEGVYRVINNTQQKPEWQNSLDHTGDVNGDMLVINGQAETFYSHKIQLTQGYFAPGNYTASLYIMNIDTLGECSPNPLLPNINFRVEYLSSDGLTWTPLTGSPYTAAPVQQTPPSSPTWLQLGSTFTLPANIGFNVSSIRIVLNDGTIGGCGNDFAMDDVKFSLCPEGGPLPVQFLNITAIQKGSGVGIDWATALEINSSHFDVEKSADGNSNWNVVASINAAGNSSTVKNYNAYDPTPSNGVNFYRIKQVDIDGNFTFSKTVSVKLNLDKTGISVLANPFHNTLSVDFSSTTSQAVSARLMDITGRQVAVEKWSITAGTSRKEFSNVNGLQQGMYILTVSNAGGAILYNNKVIKQ